MKRTNSTFESPPKSRPPTAFQSPQAKKIVKVEHNTPHKDDISRLRVHLAELYDNFDLVVTGSMALYLLLINKGIPPTFVPHDLDIILQEKIVPVKELKERGYKLLNTGADPTTTTGLKFIYKNKTEVDVMLNTQKKQTPSIDVNYFGTCYHVIKPEALLLQYIEQPDSATNRLKIDLLQQLLHS